MVTFRSNNNRRPPFRSSNNRRPSFRNNNEGSKFSNNDNFQRKIPGRNNHNALKLIEKYNEMAREALANEDRVLSENYFQHADHFTRVQNEQDKIRKAKLNSSSADTANSIKSEINSEDKLVKNIKTEETTKTNLGSEVKDSEKKPEEKKSVAS
jgi:5'-3' exonuclease